MKRERAEYSRIKNLKSPHFTRDFTFNSYSFLLLGIFLMIGIVLEWVVNPQLDPMAVGYYALSVLASGFLLIFLSRWIAVIVLSLGVTLFLPFVFEIPSLFLFLGGSLGLLSGGSIELATHWQKVVILRLGKFHRTAGPGLFFLIPLLDKIADNLDMRIKVTDFKAEKNITSDTVPVDVDALCFWMIWDAKQAILEVEDYFEAVNLSAQTALRDAIGRNDLSRLLSDRETLGREIQQTLDKKTNPWGLTILSIEFTSVLIPKDLEDAMSRKAQSQREKQSRIILSKAEKRIAEEFKEASKIYESSHEALHLRAMSMVYEGMQKNGSLILLPASALESMNLGSSLALSTLAEQKEREKKEQERDEQVEISKTPDPSPS